MEKGVAVCDGYAYAFQKIIEHYDIPVKDIHGKADNGSGYMGHTWKKSAYPKATATDPDRYITTGGKSQIKISSLKDDFYVGKTATLTVSGTTKKATWSSSNKKIVTEA